MVSITLRLIYKTSCPKLMTKKIMINLINQRYKIKNLLTYCVNKILRLKMIWREPKLGWTILIKKKKWIKDGKWALMNIVIILPLKWTSGWSWMNIDLNSKCKFFILVKWYNLSYGLTFLILQIFCELIIAVSLPKNRRAQRMIMTDNYSCLYSCFCFPQFFCLF